MAGSQSKNVDVSRCEKCNYSTSLKGNLKTHLSLKHKTSSNEDIIPGMDQEDIDDLLNDGPENYI